MKTRPTSAAKAGPGRPRKLTREGINAAALELMEEEGFSSLSMRSLAQRLGASPASLYNYIGHIEDVENDVLEGLMAQLPIPSRERPEPLRLQLIEHLLAVRWQQMLHPHFLHTPVGSTTWRRQMKATAQVLKALAPDENRLVQSAVGYNALIAVVSATAERARTVGQHAFYEAERKALLALRGPDYEILQKPFRSGRGVAPMDTLVLRLNYLIDCLLPHLAAVPLKDLKELEGRLQDVIDGPWAHRPAAKIKK